MARIAGVDIPREKRIEVALTYIYGIGPTTAKKILVKTGINPNLRVRDMKTDDVAAIRNMIAAEFKVEGALKAEVTMNIKRLMDIGCYRGLRHRRNLPVRGQRTHTNARTRRGIRRISVGTKKKKASEE